MQEYACKGYRTLCFASTSIHPQFYKEWAERFKKASISLENREKKLADVAEEIEKNFTLIGATAIEDKLQDVENFILLLNFFYKTQGISV